VGAPRGVSVEKPRANVYTVMLVVSLIAIVVGISCLAGEMSEYGWDFKAAGAKVPADTPDLPPGPPPVETPPPAVVPPAATPEATAPEATVPPAEVTPPAETAPAETPADVPPAEAPPGTPPPM
jgi:hypothetical protein